MTELIDPYGNPLTSGHSLEDPYGDPRDPSPRHPRRPRGNELYLQIPQIELLGDWTTKKAKALAFAHDLGQFSMSSRLYYGLLMDPRVVDGCEKRALALRQLPFDIHPGRGRGASKLAKKAALHFPDMLPAAVVSENFFQSLLLGFGVGQPDWAYHFEDDDLFYPKLTPWHPQLLYYLNSAIIGGRRGSAPGQLYTYVQGTESGAGSTVAVPIITGTGQWFCFSLYGVDKPFMYGKMRSVWRPWILRMLDANGWGRYNDVHGMPIRGVVVPVRYRKTPEGRRFFRTVSEIGQDATTYMPQARDGKSAFDIKLIEAKAKTYDTFRLSREEWAKEITLALTGGLDTFSEKGDNYKRSQAKNDVRYEIKIADALAWEAAVNAQIMVPFAVLNGYDEAAAPRVVYDVRPQKSLLEAARTAGEESDSILKAFAVVEAFQKKGYELPILDYLESQGLRIPPSIREIETAKGSKSSGGRGRASAAAWARTFEQLRDPVQVWRFGGGLGSRAESALLQRSELLRPREGFGQEPGPGWLSMRRAA